MQIYDGWRLAAFDYAPDREALTLDVYGGGDVSYVTLFVDDEEYEAMKPRLEWWLESDVPLSVLVWGNIVSVIEEEPNRIDKDTDEDVD